MAIAQVSWDDYTMAKKVGGQSLIFPEDAMRALMSKWIIQALLLGQSNMQVLLRYHIMQLQHCYHGSWGPSSLWLFSPNFSIKSRSKVQSHIAQS